MKLKDTQFFFCNLIPVQSSSIFTKLYLEGSAFMIWVYFLHKHTFIISCEDYFLNIGFPILYHPSKSLICVMNSQAQRQKKCMIKV